MPQRACLLAVSALVVTSLAVGCSSGGGASGDEGPAAADTTVSESGGGSGEEQGQAGDTAALEQLYRDYWDALVALEGGEELDPGLFRGIATPGLTEEQMTRVRPMKQNGILREGAPVLGEITVELLSEDEGRIESCVNPEGWKAVQDGEEMPIQSVGRFPGVVLAERTPDGWLISDERPSEEASLSC